MEGYRLWRFEGLNRPQIVMQAVKEYRNEMDVISTFLDSEYCTSGGEVKASQLYAVYCQWAGENNEYKMPSRKFGIEISIKKMAGIIWASHYNKTIRNDGYDTYTSIYIPLKEKKKKYKIIYNIIKYKSYLSSWRIK